MRRHTTRADRRRERLRGCIKRSGAHAAGETGMEMVCGPRRAHRTSPHPARTDTEQRTQRTGPSRKRESRATQSRKCAGFRGPTAVLPDVFPELSGALRFHGQRLPSVLGGLRQRTQSLVSFCNNTD